MDPACKAALTTGIDTKQISPTTVGEFITQETSHMLDNGSILGSWSLVVKQVIISLGTGP